jgi:hypothetical protein
VRSHDLSGVGQAPQLWNSGGGLKLLEICPPVFKVSFTIGLNGRYKSLRHGYLCFPEIVTGDEQASR